MKKSKCDRWNDRKKYLIVNIVDIAISLRDTFTSFSWWCSRVHETNIIIGAIAVINHARAEINWAAVDNGCHSVHLMTAEQWSLNSRFSVAIHIDRFNFFRCPIRPVVMVVSNSKSEWIRQIFGNDTWLLSISVKTCKNNLSKISLFEISHASYIQSYVFRRQHNKFHQMTVKVPKSWEDWLEVRWPKCCVQYHRDLPIQFLVQVDSNQTNKFCYKFKIMKYF